MSATDAGGWMAKTKRPHRRKSEDPLVPIDGGRVRAAIEWKGLSVNGAAGRIKVSQQTLDSIVRGQTTRCYQSLREKLAKLLDLPAAWFGRETDLLPSLTPWLPLPELGYSPPLWVDENMRIVRPPAGGDLTQRSTLPPRYQLAAYELCRQITEAWKRDIADGNQEAKAALSRLAEGRWKNNPWDRLMMLVTRLVSAFWWRRLFLQPPELPAPVDPKRFTDAEWRALGETMMLQNQRRAGEELDTDDQFAAAAAAALATTLRPWFSGERELNYGFVGMLEWASGGFGKNLSPGGS
ncbi:MAG: helix-turn-helix domain-containing protein [Gemmatimonadales bacterium]